MHPNGINTIYSPYVRNTTASSSTTMIVPSSSRPPSPSDNNIKKEMVEKDVNDNTDHDHSLDVKKQKHSYYHYNSLEHPHTPLCQLHQDSRTPPMTTPLNTTTTIPIPFSPASTTATRCASSYFSTLPSCSSIPAPLHATSTITSISLTAAVNADAARPTLSTSSVTTTSKSPKKKVKRWIVAALMIVVGLLIALTFILIGLGKAFSQPHHHTTVSSSSLPLSSQSIYITTTATATTTAISTVTNLLVSPTYRPTRP